MSLGSILQGPGIIQASTAAIRGSREEKRNTQTEGETNETLWEQCPSPPMPLDLLKEQRPVMPNYLLTEQRLVMPFDLFTAAIKGNSDALVRHLALPEEEQNHIKVPLDDIPIPRQIEDVNQLNLRSATHFGDTVLHLLVTKGHNKLALEVFQKDMILLIAQNKKLETPLHCAAKIGNKMVILGLTQLNRDVVKQALGITNNSGDTALHVAAKHGHSNVCRELMKLDPEVAYRVNKDRLFPLYIAIVKRYTNMVLTMLQDDATLACIQDSNGMFPVHVAARMGYIELVMHFIEKYPNFAELRDPCGRNLFHIAAEENQKRFFQTVLKDKRFRKTIERMNTAMDYEGNTPLHIAALKGHRTIMRLFWENKMNQVVEPLPNNQGLTPLKLCARQLIETTEDNKDIEEKISKYMKSHRYEFTRRWFDDIMQTSVKNKWERTQTIGLGSVLITTVTFAAAFTIPGGYNQDNGTPVLARRYMFRAFTLANVLAFTTAFVSLFTLLLNTLRDPDRDALRFSTYLFALASSSMVVAFGLGLYVTLAPNNMAIAILILVLTLLLGSPAVFYVILTGQKFYNFVLNLSTYSMVVGIVVVSYASLFMLIFCLAFL